MSRFRINKTKLKHLNHKGKASFDVGMSDFCTFRCGGKVSALLEVNTLENFLKVILYLKEKSIPWFVLGNGSNILVSDSGYKGVVLKLGGDLARCEQVDDTLFECGAGAKLSKLFAYFSKLNLSGLEDGAGIPATVGGATFMNASAYNFAMENIVEYVVAFVDGKISYFDRTSCQFGYRTSVFQQNNAVILRVGIRLKSLDKESIMARFVEVAKKRAHTQPLNMPSAGCVFKRSNDVCVSRLIDEAGLKGLTINGAQVSLKHANFIVNTGNARAQDIYELIKLTKNKIQQKYGIELETEIRFLGEFE